MRSSTVLPIAMTVAIASSCTPSAPQSLSGQSYQETDSDSELYRRIGIEFVDESRFVLKFYDQELIELPGQYTVASDSITAQIDNPEFATANIQMQRQGNTLDVSIDDLDITLESVDEVALTDEPFDDSAPNAEADARTYITSINRGQQIYFVENEQFATAIADLDLGIPNATEQYDIAMASDADVSVSLATAQSSELNSYLGIVIIEDTTTRSLLCEVTSEDGSIPAPSLIISQLEPRSRECPLGNAI